MLACFQRLMCPGVLRVPTLACVYYQFHPPTLSPSCYTLSLVFLSPSSSLLIPLSDEQIELLNELFLWAPNAHPKLSICSFPPSVRLLLPPSHHPSFTPLPQLHLLLFFLQQCLHVQTLETCRLQGFINIFIKTQSDVVQKYAKSESEK